MNRIIRRIDNEHKYFEDKIYIYKHSKNIQNIFDNVKFEKKYDNDVYYTKVLINNEIIMILLYDDNYPFKSCIMNYNHLLVYHNIFS